MLGESRTDLAILFPQQDRQRLPFAEDVSKHSNMLLAVVD